MLISRYLIYDQRCNMAIRTTFVYSSAFTFIIYAFIHLSGSITSAEVDLVPMHDVSICGGMKALFNCTTDNDFLQWTINGVPLDAFTSSTTDGDCDNVTFKGSVFCFTSASDDSGEIVYISTASINILQTTDVSCSNGTHTKTHTVNLEVNHIVNNISGSVNEDNIITTWSAPTDAGICCERYRVVTSDGDDVTINTTSYTLYNITTLEQREHAIITVRCLDQFGTEGPAFFFKPNITLPLVVIFPPEPHGNFCGNNITYEIKLVIQESGALVAEIKHCNIDGHNCSLESRNASITTNGLVSFNVSISFTYYLGHESTDHQVTLGASQIRTLQEACKYRAQPLPPWLCYASIGILALISFICFPVAVILKIIGCLQQKRKKNNLADLKSRPK